MMFSQSLRRKAAIIQAPLVCSRYDLLLYIMRRFDKMMVDSATLLVSLPNMLALIALDVTALDVALVLIREETHPHVIV